MNEIILTESASSSFVMLHVIIDNLRNGLETQAKDIRDTLYFGSL